MKFGHWNITPVAIEWAGSSFNRFVIDRASLLETILVDEASEPLYKWIVLATQEDWLSNDALYDLNFAFVFAAGQSNENFDYGLLDKTLDYQFDILDDEEDDEP